MSTTTDFSGIEQIIQQLESAIHNTYHFADKAVPWEALQSPGSRFVMMGAGLNGRPLTSDANKPMALIGDAVLRQIFVTETVTAGFSKGRVQDEISRLLSNNTLDRVGRQANLDMLVQRGVTHAGPIGNQTMATTVEAIIGAVFVDSDHDEKPVKRVMQALNLWPAGLPPSTPSQTNVKIFDDNLRPDPPPATGGTLETLARGSPGYLCVQDPPQVLSTHSCIVTV